jgi:hypothetical protein
MSANFATGKAMESQWRNNPQMAANLLTALQSVYPNNLILNVHWSHPVNDKKGVDAFIEFDNCHVHRVDFKFRSHNAQVDWLTIETLSNVEKNQIGWAGKQTQANDVIFIRALPNGIISDAVRIDARALRELVCTRLDALRAVGTAKRASSFGKYDSWSGEFVAVSPESLKRLIEKVVHVNFVGGDQ